MLVPRSADPLQVTNVNKCSSKSKLSDDLSYQSDASKKFSFNERGHLLTHHIVQSKEENPQVLQILIGKFYIFVLFMLPFYFLLSSIIIIKFIYY